MKFSRSHKIHLNLDEIYAMSVYEVAVEVTVGLPQLCPTTTQNTLKTSICNKGPYTLESLIVPLRVIRSLVSMGLWTLNIIAFHVTKV